MSSTAGWIGALRRAASVGPDPSRTLPRVIDEIAAKQPDAPALIGDAEAFNFAELAACQNRYARWGLAQNIAPGDRIGLMMPNRPEYLAAWLGLTRIGAVVALLNTKLRGASLAHCLEVADMRGVIVASELRDAFESAGPYLSRPLDLWIRGSGGLLNEQLEPEGLSGAPLGRDEAPEVGLSDPALLIYTSGTTGLPKAAHVSHHRIMMWSEWFAGLMDVQPHDRMYDCLPLYHSIGGVVATGSLLVAGGSVVVRERFSVRRFWDDVVENRCTLFQYIGELCRYLLQAPPHPLERAHGLRLCAGNGLRADVWQPFQERFGIPRILEFYAATEGTVSLYNVEGKVGAVGRVPPFMAHRSPAAIVKFDPDSATPLRGQDGLCLRAARDEVGELIGRLASGPAPSAQRFEGYTDAADSERKVLRDVFEPGDAWLRTGDLMRQDEQGFFHFVDRAGDTFRWKGENVSTLEVAEALCRAPGIEDAVVFGVAVPGMEGRAGMAALRITADFDPKRLHAELTGRLPPYARPVFLRIRDAFELTDTFKQKKSVLAEEGFDLARVAEALFVQDPEQGAYVPLTRGILERITAGGMRL
jgi:fatty-acyl-CoA synthase